VEEAQDFDLMRIGFYAEQHEVPALATVSRHMYDPAHFNDRLLLGLKGTMSEAELHVVKEFHAKDLLFPRRLRSGAHKGELVWAERCSVGICVSCTSMATYARPPVSG